MPHSWLSGEAPTMLNAQVLIGRLHRQAGLQPSNAKVCLEEAEVIFELAASGQLPPGHAPFEPKQQPLPAPIWSRWHYFYSALTGRRPPAEPHNAKIKARWGQYYFLSANGTLRQGITPSRACALPKARVQEILAEGQARLKPKKFATLADLDDLTPSHT